MLWPVAGARRAPSGVFAGDRGPAGDAKAELKSGREKARLVESGQASPPFHRGCPLAHPTTIAQLRQSEYRVLPVKEEMRKNLVRKIKASEELFPGIIGYEGSVIPQVENAILSDQDIVFLGERGQAKSRLIRSLVQLLDEQVPVIEGCEINDSPYAPICRACRDRVAAQGDQVTVRWISPDERYSEKLATPDTSIADLIGEVDPIRVAEGKYLADELTIHYGLVPRTNRGIFAINELPDLAERIQVGLLTLIEERAERPPACVADRQDRGGATDHGPPLDHSVERRQARDGDVGRGRRPDGAGKDHQDRGAQRLPASLRGDPVHRAGTALRCRSHV